MTKKIINLIIFVYFCVCSVFFINTICKNRNIFTERYDYRTYKKKFDQSQWIVTNKNKIIISDADLYTFAASELLQQKDPTFMNFETPPLGKYLIAASLLLFDNQRVMSLIIAILSLLLIFYLVFVNSKSIIASLLAVSLTANSWFFIDQVIYSPQMEIFQLFFFLIFIIFFTQYETKKLKKYLIYAAIAAGAFVSIKVFFIHLLLFNAWIVFYYFLKKKDKQYILSALSTLNIGIFIVYVFYYLNFFLNGGNLIKFFLVQKWIIGLYTVRSNIETTRLIGSYLPLIYFNKWKFWSEGYPVIQYQNWSILWPIMHAFGLISLFILYLKKVIQKNISYSLLASFIIIYSIFLLFTPIWPRYLLLLYVPLYMIMTVVFSNML